MSEASFFEIVGGRDYLLKVHGKFYDKVFAHPVLGPFFKGKGKEHQQEQLTDFMMRIFGGPIMYCGRLPKAAHEHMFITDDIFKMRHDLLADTLKELGLAPELCDRWLHYDQEFVHILTKKSIDECKKRFTTDEILFAPAMA